MKKIPVITYAITLMTVFTYGTEPALEEPEPSTPDIPYVTKQEPVFGNYFPSYDCLPECCVDLFADASFTYWCAGEEGLKVASNGVFNAKTFFFAPTTSSIYQSFDYKPGFKLGIGMKRDNEWSICSEYTWFRGSGTTRGNRLSNTLPTAGTTTAANGSNVWVVDDWFLQGNTVGQAICGSSVFSKWHLSLDLVDLVLDRLYGQESCAQFSSFAGLRSAFIRQSMNVGLIESNSLFSGALPSQPISSRNYSNSWSVGPRAGCTAKLILPMGFNIEGALAGSLLYTRYMNVKHSEDMASISFNPGPYKASLNNYSALRPASELKAGIGWGTDFGCGNYRLDLSATYDFMFFWSQNMIRKLLDDVLTGTSSSPADLYLYGTTITLKFDF